VFNVFVYAKQTSKFKFFDTNNQIDLLVDPYETNVLYNKEHKVIVSLLWKSS
jgi:hypothetical protein